MSSAKDRNFGEWGNAANGDTGTTPFPKAAREEGREETLRQLAGCAGHNSKLLGSGYNPFCPECEANGKLVGVGYDAGVAESAAWKRALEDACIIGHLYFTDDPKATLNNLIAWEVQIALDPKVSEAAEKLVERGRAESAARATRAEDARKHTQDWYAAHYGKLEDWARKRLPEPWVTEFFNCVANGTWGHDDVGEPYMSQVGKIVPSGYFKMETAAEQFLHDQTTRAESAERKNEELRKALRDAQTIVHRGQFHQWKTLEQCTEPSCKSVVKLLGEDR